MRERPEAAHLWAWGTGGTGGRGTREGRQGKMAGSPGGAMRATPTAGVYPTSRGRARDAGPVGWRDQKRKARGS